MSSFSCPFRRSTIRCSIELLIIALHVCHPSCRKVVLKSVWKTSSLLSLPPAAILEDASIHRSRMQFKYERARPVDNPAVQLTIGVEHYTVFATLQISFAAALSSLSDRTRFKSYFRTTPSFNEYAPAILGLLNKFNWKRVAFITENQNLFHKVCFPCSCIINYSMLFSFNDSYEGSVSMEHIIILHSDVLCIV